VTVPRCALAVCLPALALPAAAPADVVTSRDRDGVAADVAERFALTAAERRALDIDSVQVMGHEGLGVVIDVRFKADVPRVRPGPGALRRVDVVLDLPTRGLVDVRVGGSVKFLLRGAGYARLERVQVASNVGPRRAEGAPVLADSHELFLDPADTTPHRHECIEAAPMYDDITQAIGALDVRIFRLERTGTREGETWRRLRAKRDVALALGGDAEVRYPSC
jgi:hypothetical protein